MGGEGEEHVVRIVSAPFCALRLLNDAQYIFEIGETESENVM